jgi:deoxyribodipyrimidine photo-lyase
MSVIEGDFPPSREAALQRLAEFVPGAGQFYAQGRNSDAGPGGPGAVSRLSPYLRRRLITEAEVVSAVLARHSLESAEKFVQEVLWRTYWKGWLEMRPAVWTRFLAERERHRTELGDLAALSAAESGMTGIEGFDDWARELVETGYLHNHARLWFASIWIFTLRLPWTLGADFFLRHLIDADAASNTLSWRWVAGLQTVGKTYLATAENIARHTNGRFAPKGLARAAVALTEPALEPPRPLPAADRPDERQPALLLVTDEDMHPQSLFRAASPFKAALIAADPSLLWGNRARRFLEGAASDTVARVAAHYGCPVDLAHQLEAETLSAAASAAGVELIVTAYPPVGPTADAIDRLVPPLAAQGIRLARLRRNWDGQFWPHATKGFFAFKQRMATILAESGLS